MLGHLIAAVGARAHRPAGPGSVERQPDLGVAGAGRQLRERRADGAQAAQAVAGRADAIDGAGGADSRRPPPAPSPRVSTFISMMTRHVRIALEHVAQRRDADALAGETEIARARRLKRQPASTRASSAAVSAATGPDASVVRSSVASWQTTGTPSADRWTSQLEAVGAGRQPQIERGERVLGPERAAAAMGKHAADAASRRKASRSSQPISQHRVSELSSGYR